MTFSRTDAPGELRKLEDFCNSARFLSTEDALITPESTTGWLRARGIETRDLSRKDHERLITVREIIRDHLGGEERTADLNKLARAVLAGPRWSPGGDPVLPVRRADPVDVYVGSLLAVLFAAGITGELDRLKTCRNPDCRWVFYDRSPAQNSVWCSMDVCGARNKMRTYRSRHAR